MCREHWNTGYWALRPQAEHWFVLCMDQFVSSVQFLLEHVAHRSSVLSFTYEIVWCS